MYGDLTIDVEAGPVRSLPVLPTITDVVLLSGDGYLCGWALREAGGELPLEAEGSVTTPAAGATIASIGSLGDGTYLVNWTVQLAGTPAAADANNFGLYDGATLIATSVNLGAAGEYPQPPVEVTVGISGTIAVKAIVAGTSGAIYSTSFTITPAGSSDAISELQDLSNPIGEISIPAGGVNNQWFGPQGVRICGQIKLHIISGVTAGVVYARYWK